MQMDDITKKTFKCIFTLFHTGKGEMLNNFNGGEVSERGFCG